MPSSGSQDKTTAYAAAELREVLAGNVEDVAVEHVREFAGQVTDESVVRLLDYYCSLYEDKGLEFMDTRMAQIILSGAATASTTEAVREGNLSQMKNVSGLTKESERSKEALSEVADRLADEGAIVFIVGPPGSGKTALMADVTQVWGAMTGGAVVSNLDWRGADAHVETDREMFRAMGSRPGQVLAALDELSQELTGRGSDQARAAEFSKAITLVRKYEEKHGQHAKQGSIVGVAHTFKSLAPSLKRLATLVVQKPSRKDQGRVKLLESEGGTEEFEEIMDTKGLTDTRETYSEHDASDFQVVGDEEDDGEDVDPEEAARNAAERKDIETAIRRILEDGDSQGDAADRTDFSRGWVGDRWREWVDGEHRELVERPANLSDDDLPQGTTADDVVTV